MSQEASSHPFSPRQTARPALQQRVAASILEAAARVLAARGADANMSEVAAAAGVARATVYRYFPNRQALLSELAAVAIADAGSRLAAARVDEIEPRLAVERAIRALVEVGDPILVLAREHVAPDPVQFENEVGAPLRQIFERGQAGGGLRDDIPAAWLADALVAVVVAGLRSMPTLGRDDTISTLVGLLLDGAGVRPRLHRGDGRLVSREVSSERTEE